MPSSVLFAINNEGRVHTLSTTGSVWRELPYVGQEFKRLSAVPHFLWALGGDHQIYVYVHGLDIPIKVREESYENERWIPIEGFTSRLLPTDRYHYSSMDGSIDRSIDKIRLPSMAWQWEGDWQLDLTLAGQPLDHNGWTYAIDFPAQYYPKKQWKSCVRRRLWVRTRRYSAMNSWCAIAPLHKDATTEPFIDISIGGQHVMGAQAGTMLVWAVTSHNRVMFRTGVTTKSPEGAKWISILVPPGCEINQISVGPTGLVWASLLDGRALIRIGITRDSLIGESWVEIRGPLDNSRLVQVSVGVCAVWAITQDKQVWFRKGIKGEGSGISEELAVGCGWVDMVGRMSSISVSSNDQVWGVGADDRIVYFRMGVSIADLTGKRWRALHAPLQVSRASSNASLNRDKFHRSCNNLNQRPHSISEITGISEWEEQSHSAPTAPISLPVGEITGKHFETQLKNPKAWSPVRSVGSVVGTEVHPEMDHSVWQADDSGNSSVFYDENDELCWAESEAPWAWVDGGACTVDPAQLPNWFIEAGSLQQAELEQPWRLQILEHLKSRVPLESFYSDYESAVDTISWTHSGEARISLNPPSFTECVVQLEWIHTNGIITILNPDGATTMHQFSVSDISCVQCCTEPGSPRLAVYTPYLSPTYIRLQFSSDTILEEWQVHLASVCAQVHSISGKPKESSIWATTTLGDIFVSDILNLEASQLNEDKMYTQEIDLAGKSVPYAIPLLGGFVPGSQLILTGCTADDADRMSINLEAHCTYKLRHKAHNELQNINFHFNPRFEDNVVIKNSLIEDKWGEEERENFIPFKRGQEFMLRIECQADAYVIYVNDKEYCKYRHRISPYAVSDLTMWGKLQPFKLVIKSIIPILDIRERYWRQLGGHLKKVESCLSGVTWGIGCDNTAWVYNGGWGGNFFASLDTHNVNPMTDSQDYRVYENQRWNPLTGYTSTGLPTDRHMWSDITGKQRRTRDQVKLLCMHWQWVSDWLVDFHVPGGVDREGWQYATDFPSTYHANKQFTDCVRRRRWYRRCAIATTGPWQELGHTKLIAVSLETIDDSVDSTVSVWALASGGQAMFRVGVSQSNPMGSVWEHVNSDQALSSISCSPFNQVWATGKNGCAYWRVGITSNKPAGDSWACVEPPSSSQLKQISVGEMGVWALDHMGILHVRKEVTHVFPEGTYWQSVTPDPRVLSSAHGTSGFKQVNVVKSQVWALTDSGVALKRHGICSDNPSGTGWIIGTPGNWQYLSIGALK